MVNPRLSMITPCKEVDIHGQSIDAMNYRWISVDNPWIQRFHNNIRVMGLGRLVVIAALID